MDPIDLQEVEEAAEEKSFAELLAETQLERERLERGQRVEGVVVQITPEWVFLDMGGKSEGVIDRKEFLDEQGKLTVRVGDTVGAYYLAMRNNERIFTTRITGGQAARNFLQEAYRNAIPVEGSVEREVKGGFEIKVAGGLKGFCPFSHMELYRVADPSTFLGRRLEFRIIDYADGGRRLVLSRRALLEEQKAQRKEELKELIKEGMLVKGKVVSIRDFGAFLDIGGVQGLLPVSEVALERVQRIKDHLSIGQELEVVILQLDWEKDRITLSLRQTLPDPWENVAQRYPEGSRHTGKIVRLTAFGAFVSLEPGLDGLIHLSRLGAGKRISHPKEVLSQGQEVTVKVESLDPERKRLSLSLADEQDQEESSESQILEDYKKKAVTSPVTFGDLLKEKLTSQPE
ncbi:MAG: 30S ribosomal protein S1 [bacterium]